MFIKPELRFPLDYNYPLISIWITAEYRKVVDEVTMHQFIHNCLHVVETTQNDVKREEYRKVAYTMYSVMTGKSYESSLPKNPNYV